LSSFKLVGKKITFSQKELKRLTEKVATKKSFLKRSGKKRHLCEKERFDELPQHLHFDRLLCVCVCARVWMQNQSGWRTGQNTSKKFLVLKTKRCSSSYKNFTSLSKAWELIYINKCTMLNASKTISTPKFLDSLNKCNISIQSRLVIEGILVLGFRFQVLKILSFMKRCEQQFNVKKLINEL
jgi:hypothetical protein